MNLEDTQVTRIRPHTFDHGIKLQRQSTLLLPTSLKYIETSAFEKTYGFHKVLFPKTLISIGENAFYGSSLRELLFESYDIDHTLQIGQMAFQMARIMSPEFSKLVQGSNAAGYNVDDIVVLPKNTEIYIDRSSVGQGTLGAFEEGTKIKFVTEAEMSQLRRDRNRDQRNDESDEPGEISNIDDFLEMMDKKSQRKYELKMAAREKELDLAARERFDLAVRRFRTKK